jgi:HAMP domain-containing protein
MREHVRSPLLRKYVRVLSVLVGGTLMLSGLAELYFSYAQAQRAIVEVEQAHATAAALRIEQFLSEVQEQVRDTTRTASDDSSAGPPGVAALGFREGLAASIAEQRELDFLRVLRRVPAISDLRHLDVSGREVIRVSRLHPDVMGSGTDYSSAPEFVAARRGATYWSPVRLRDDAEPYVIVAMPVGRYAVEVTTAEVGLRTLQRIVSRLAVGVGGYAYVVDAQDQLIAHPDARTLRERRDLSHLAQVAGARMHLADGATATASAMFADGVAGGRVLAAHAAIMPLGWLVFVERPAADAYAALREPILRSLVIFVLGLALAVLASAFLARRMVAPIRKLQAGAARMGAGDLDHRVVVATGDELEALGDELNRSAAELAGARATLEQKVESRTHELARSLEELHVLGEVALAVSSSLDLDTVLDTIVARAVQLAGAHGGVLYEYDAGTESFSWIRGTFAVEDELLQV